ncbi:MAG: hypothetical protein ACYTBJ_01090 [Planctomycetota bacterium]|jgi:hypothetical protein
MEKKDRIELLESALGIKVDGDFDNLKLIDRLLSRRKRFALYCEPGTGYMAIDAASIGAVMKQLDEVAIEGWGGLWPADDDGPNSDFEAFFLERNGDATPICHAAPGRWDDRYPYPNKD